MARKKPYFQDNMEKNTKNIKTRESKNIKTQKHENTKTRKHENTKHAMKHSGVKNPEM